jgi:uncharacterized protein (UPF0212 family)
MSPVGFEATISVFEQAKTVHASGSAATVMGCALETATLNYLEMNPDLYK